MINLTVLFRVYLKEMQIDLILQGQLRVRFAPDLGLNLHIIMH